MSVKAMTRVWNHSKHTRSNKLVLLAIADNCRYDDGTGAYPSQATIALKTGLSDRRIRTIQGKLIASGELLIEERPGTSHLYTVNVTPDETSDPCRCFGCRDWQKLPAPPAQIATQGGQNFLPPRNTTSDEPYLTVPRNQKEPSTSEEAAPSAAVSLRSENGVRGTTSEKDLADAGILLRRKAKAAAAAWVAAQPR
jgi:hypothetical protein